MHYLRISLFTKPWLGICLSLPLCLLIHPTTQFAYALASNFCLDCIFISSASSFHFSFSLSISTSPGEPPEFRDTFRTRTVHVGEFGLNLKCSAFGSPLPQIRWFFYNKQIRDSLVTMRYKNRYRIADYVNEQGTIISYLNISSVSAQDGGLFSCEAVNDLGTRRHSALIQVYGPPIVHDMDNVSVVTEGKLELDCAFSGYPVQVMWTKGTVIVLLVNSFSCFFLSRLSLSCGHLARSLLMTSSLFSEQFIKSKNYS